MKKTFVLLGLLAFIGLVFGASIIQIRRDTAANWTAVDPTLAQGEIGFELVTGKIKFGDGVTAWSALPYFTVAGFLTWADANAAFVPYVGADYDLNMGNYGINVQGNAFLKNLVVSKDLNVIGKINADANVYIDGNVHAARYCFTTDCKSYIDWNGTHTVWHG